MTSRFAFALTMTLILAGGAGCFNPPRAQLPPESKRSTVIGAPYDLTWDAVHSVIKKNDYRLEADDPDHGIVEAEAHSFTLADADCGQIRGVVGRYDADAAPGATAVYNFRVRPSGKEASSVLVNATFSTPLHLPLQRPRDLICVSRGTAEVRLLKEIAEAAAAEHRPLALPSLPSEAAETERPEPLTPGGPTLMRPQLPKMEIH